MKDPKRTHDERRVSSNDDGPGLSSDINQGNNDSGATSMDETNNTHPEGTSVKPTCYKEAILDINWIDAMNAEIEALNENHT
ncbi:hypothetical protein Tco_1317251 [Tanacetum coccineum]